MIVLKFGVVYMYIYQLNLINVSDVEMWLQYLN